MNRSDKSLCKAMIRQAMEDYRQYNRYNVAGYSEKLLVWRFMESVLDYLPNVTEYRKHQIRYYCDRMMSRLLGI